MDIIDEFKKEALKKLKKLHYENKKLKQLNDDLTKQKTTLETSLNHSKSETAKVTAESRHYQKIIAGQKKKIIEDGLVETDEEMGFELPNNLNKTEKINVTGERKTPKQ
jgi:hypothetical protein